MFCNFVIIRLFYYHHRVDYKIPFVAYYEKYNKNYCQNYPRLLVDYLLAPRFDRDLKILLKLDQALVLSSCIFYVGTRNFYIYFTVKTQSVINEA